MFIERNFEPDALTELVIPHRAAPRCYDTKPPTSETTSTPAIQTAAIAIGLAASVGMATILLTAA